MKCPEMQKHMWVEVILIWIVIDMHLKPVPVVLGKDIDRRRGVSAPSTDHLHVDGGRSVNVPSLAPVLPGFQSPQRLLLLPFLRTQLLPRVRVITVPITAAAVSRHCSEKL